ncbi:MAG: hypothetical protein MJ252_17470 [archaeon]|nr:hypothetical protein [archaeon]
MLISGNQSSTAIPEFMSKTELESILDQIIAAPYKCHINDWLYYAKPNEKKGLYILSKVVKYKGEKMFKTQLTTTTEDKFDISKLTLEEAFRRYQQKKCQSSYTDFYGGAVDQKFKYNNILHCRQFQHLNYAEFINKDYHYYIQQWINIEKTEQYKEYVLDFLRSFLATIRSNRKFVTNYHEDYKESKPWDKFSTHAVYLDNRTPIEVNNPTIEEMQEKLALERQAIIDKEKNSGIVYNDQIQNQEEIKKRKEELSNGQKNLLKGIYNNVTVTSYQDTYK